MKSSIITPMSGALVAILVLGGCSRQKRVQPSRSAPSGQRVIKVSFKGQNGFFRMRVNQQPVERFRNTEFTNVMTRFRLDYGDIVVWEAQRDDNGKELSHPQDISTWWFKHLENVRASFYSIRSDSVADFFAIPIYHWNASAEKPRPLQDATFLVDGVALGRGSLGFQVMMNTIEATKSGPVFIVAPRIKNEGQASPSIADDQLLAWAEGAGVSQRFKKIFFGRFGGLVDFARLSDE